MQRIFRKIRKRAALWFCLLLVLALIAAYVWGWPWVESLTISGNDVRDTSVVRLSSSEQFLSRLMTAVFTFWIFFVGATIGSFLNVVVYRLPLGKSVVLQPSHCPFCKANIKAWHNIPIFGWVALNGRCRNCRLPISARYPTVELLCGMIFLLVFFVQLVSGGWNLPFREINEKWGVARTVFDPQWDLIVITLFHLFMFCALLTGSLIHWDRQTIPKRFWLTTGFFAAVISMVVPFVRLWPWTFPFTELPFSNASINVLVDLVVGATVGTCLGIALSKIVRRASDSTSILQQAQGLPICLGLIGIFLGWQSTIFIALFSVLIAIIVHLVFSPDRTKQTVPWFLVVSLTALVHHCFWRTEWNLIQLGNPIINMVGLLFVSLMFGFIFRFQSGLSERSSTE